MPAILAIIVIALTLGYAGSHPDGMTAPTTAPNHSASTPDDGCDHVNIQQGDHPYTQAEIDRMTRMATEFCQKLTKAMTSIPEPSSFHTAADVTTRVRSD